MSRLLSTKQLAHLLHARPREVFALAHRLGLNPGAEVAFDRDGEPVSRRVWPSDWITELRAELARQDANGIDIDDLCVPAEFGSDDEYDALLHALGILA